jgi:hypothetical protein
VTNAPDGCVSTKVKLVINASTARMLGLHCAGHAALDGQRGDAASS